MDLIFAVSIAHKISGRTWPWNPWERL